MDNFGIEVILGLVEDPVNKIWWKNDSIFGDCRYDAGEALERILKAVS